MILVAVAAAATAAHLRAVVIGALLLLAWAVVAVLEWALAQTEPHYGSGMPPRYYVPQIRLPRRRYVSAATAPTLVLPPATEPATPAPVRLPAPHAHPAWPQREEPAWFEPEVEPEVVAAEAVPEVVDEVTPPEAVEDLPLVEPAEDLPVAVDPSWLPRADRPERRAPGADWFDAELPGGAVLEPVRHEADEVFDEPEERIDEFEQHVLEALAEPEREPVAEIVEPSADEPEPDQDVDYYRRLADELRSTAFEPSWFDAELPGSDVPAAPLPDGDTLLRHAFEELDLEWTAEAAPVQEPRAEPQWDEPETIRPDEEEEDVVIDFRKAAAELALQPGAWADWFTAELPGAEPTVDVFAATDEDGEGGDDDGPSPGWRFLAGRKRSH
ncbi:MAG: hypothetical protein JO064_06180 [Actinobacteria bacterium]|nr:hypothetical protein [Actinomycetota bacterium]